MARKNCNYPTLAGRRGRRTTAAAWLALALAAASAAVGGEPCEPEWAANLFCHFGVAGNVNAALVWDDGTGEGLYIGGQFGSPGCAAATHIARWNMTTSLWEPLGVGVNGEVHALAVYDDGTGEALYAGGAFTMAGGANAFRIARWDGTAWSALPGSAINNVNALVVHDDGDGPALFVGGAFTVMGGVAANRVARWNGVSWSALGLGVNDIVWALASFDDGVTNALYVGGQFTTAGGMTANRIARWHGGEWSTLGTGMNNRVNALAVYNDGAGHALHAAGMFTTAGGVGANRIARWNAGTSTWSPLGSGASGSIRALAVVDTGGAPSLYAGGFFTSAGGVGANNVARWSGTSWLGLGSGVSGEVRALAAHHSEPIGDTSAVYVGGFYASAGGVLANNIARWDALSGVWSTLGSGIGGGSGVVTSSAVLDDGGGESLYLAGDFTTAGGVGVARIVRWDGAGWSPLGSGLDGYVESLAVFDDGDGPALYASGHFSVAGGAPASRIAKWDGSAWSSLGDGLGWAARAMVVFDDGTGPALYVGGAFTTAGGAPANRIAKWDGTSWSPLGDGLSNGEVSALAVYDDGTGPALYVGGTFTTAGGNPAVRFARWDAVNGWSAVGSGMDNAVMSMIVFDGALHIGGVFSTADGVPVNNIARWDGSEFSPLGGGVGWSGTQVGTLAVFDDGSGTALHAGGTFFASGKWTANRVTKWDPTDEAWLPLGEGVNGHVNTLAVFDDGSGVGPALFAAGSFDFAGGSRSMRIARWQGCPSEPEPVVGDLNGDGHVDVQDLLILLSSWGPCPKEGGCPADVNDSGAVDVQDLLILLANWG